MVYKAKQILRRLAKNTSECWPDLWRNEKFPSFQITEIFFFFKEKEHRFDYIKNKNKNLCTTENRAREENTHNQVNGKGLIPTINEGKETPLNRQVFIFFYFFGTWQNDTKFHLEK